MADLNLNTKKTGKGKTITIIILLLLLICTSSYIAYKELYSGKQEKPKVVEPKEQKPKIETLDIASKEVIGLFNKINQLSANWTSETYRSWLFKQDTLKATDISDEIKVATGLYQAYNNCLNTDKKCLLPTEEPTKTIITSDQVKDSINDIFGNIEYNNVNIKAADCSGDFTFDKDSNSYVGNAPNCGYGGASYDTYDYRIIKATKEEESLDIYVKVAFEHFEFAVETDNTGKIIKDSVYTIYADVNKGTELTKIDQSKYNLDNILYEYGDKLPIYKVHFEKEENKYVFKSIEKQ